jgi:hypothetical protein
LDVQVIKSLITATKHRFWPIQREPTVEDGFDVYDERIVKEIGRLIYRTNVCGDYFVNIGDCDGRIGIDRDVVWRYGRRIGDQRMQNLAAYGANEEELFSEKKASRSMGRLLRTVFDAEVLLAEAGSAKQPLLRDVWLGHQDMQMMAARDKEGSCDGLYVACWGGHNGQSHNHNDVGNFIVFADGQPFVIDVGRPTYTRQTFSLERYKIWSMQSDHHNVPTVNERMQGAGRGYGARDVQYEVEEGFAWFSADIAGAYPSTAGVKTWVRTVRLNRGESVEVKDSFELETTPGKIVENLFTPCAVRQRKAGEIVLIDSDTGKEVLLGYDGDKLKVESAEIDLDDANLRDVWGDRLHRIRLTGKELRKQDTWLIRISIARR